MIRTLAMIVLAVFATGVSGQGTLQFRVDARGADANPPNTSPNGATGLFYLKDNIFWGDAGFSTTSIIWEVFSLRDASGSALYPPDRIEWQDVGGPFGFGYAFWEPKELTSDQRAALMAGEWYLDLRNAQFPEGEYRGTLVAVPEPSILFMLVTGAVLAIVLRQSFVPTQLSESVGAGPVSR